MTNRQVVLEEEQALQEIEDLTTIFAAVNEVLGERLTATELDSALGLQGVSSVDKT